MEVADLATSIANEIYCTSIHKDGWPIGTGILYTRMQTFHVGEGTANTYTTIVNCVYICT